jgi:hypothetical protein
MVQEETRDHESIGIGAQIPTKAGCELKRLEAFVIIPRQTIVDK